MTAVRILEAPSGIFQAFADPTRLRLLNLLLERELCVCDLCALLREEQPKISRHLGCLRRAGLVSVREKGKWKYYRVPSDLDELSERLLHCIKTCLREMSPLRQECERLERHLHSDCR